MSNVKIGDKPLNNFSNDELLEWMQSYKPGIKIRDNTAKIWIAIFRSLDEQGPPMTVRGVFYNCENVYRVVEKSENGYRRVQNQVLTLRRLGILPYHFIADNTRWVRKPHTYSGLYSYLEESKKAYRRALWQNQNDYVEIWCEKDAIAGMLHDVTEPWDVPLYVVRGFASETYINMAAEQIKKQNKPAYIYYFGDWDKSGVNISKDIEKKLRGFGARFNFERAAVNKEQIKEWNLPTRIAKDKKWGDAVEIDAIPANKLRALVKDVITNHIDERAYRETLRVENLERKTLESLFNDNLGLVPNEVT